MLREGRIRRSPGRVLARLWLLMCLALPAAAETWPVRSDPYVTDLADVLGNAEELRLRSELAGLKAETGIEMAVLTLRSRADYGATPSLAAFAKGVFDAWGLGDPRRNDGILVLVATEDRDLRIALGAGYHQGYDVLTEQIAARAFLPAFREGDMASGILTGSRNVMTQIARRHASQMTPRGLPEAPPASAGGLPPWLPFSVVAAGIAVIAFARRNRDRDPSRPVPARGMARDKREDGPRKPGQVNAGPGNPRQRDHESDRASGGHSSGGGGSGRW